MTDEDRREDLIQWVALHIIPHEADVRIWLRRILRGKGSVDDVVQEAYCRLWELQGWDHIRNGRAYFFAVARSIVVHMARRADIVRFEAIEDMGTAQWEDAAPSPERVVDARLQLRRVLDVIASLPPMYRRVIEMRRIHDLSQKETAQYLGMSEKSVENYSLRGLRLIMKILAGDKEDSIPAQTAPHDESVLHAVH